MLLADLMLAIEDPSSLLQVVTAFGLDIVGVTLDVLSVIEALNGNVIVIPREVIYIENSFRPPRRDRLALYIPLTTAIARTLAKVSRFIGIGVTPRSLQFVDESEIEVLSQCKHRKFVEVLTSEFLFVAVDDKAKISAERLMYFLGETVEMCLKRDVPVVFSSYARDFKTVVHPKHIDALLHVLGFTKRERRLILEVYPLEILKLWIES